MKRLLAVNLIFAVLPALGLPLLACEREVLVRTGTQSDPFTVNAPIGTPNGGGADVWSPAGGGQAGSGAAGNAAWMGGGAAGQAALGSAGSGGGPGGLTADHLMAGIDQTNPTYDAVIQDLQVLLQGLGSIELLAVGRDGVSLVQYTGAESAVVLHVAWSGALEVRHEAARARYADTAASGTRHAALLHASGTYGIYENGGMDELSGFPAAYKEFLSANGAGLSWIEYAPRGMAQAGPAVAAQPFGAVVLQTTGGARSVLTDAQRYRARIDLSETHVAFVEYASIAAGTPGQIVVQPLAGGAPIAVAPSANHQDRPAIDGDWVVWEEYLGPTDAVIRARNLVTSEIRELSASTGFRTNADIRGTRVVWEDQQSGRGDIYFTDLASGAPARPAVSGRGHSGGVRLTEDGLVWTEAQDQHIGLMYARWR